ncbi:Detected protein of confused Function [Hibiscus syriacus]|uniref:Detected protein of confused Function n=1 Tax=Hibiscus syriacus TaxID=106335 RepID=A0A6A2WM88_HIBSY|nr:Detected protein of confused Function [Hibiscus syriacus]
MNFRKGKYLYYGRGGDYCKGMNQYLWSFFCGLGQAMYLNRTFVMDLNLCLSATSSSSNRDEEGKDFRFYFDFEHLKETVSIVGESELRDWKKWDEEHKRKVTVKKLKAHKVTPMQLKKDKSTVIWSGRMDWDFDALHVVRGAKAQNKQLWPHLDSDTSPDAILTKVHLLDDYKELWSDKSEWYNETTMLNIRKPVEFNGYMRVAVDTEVRYRSKI